MIRNNKKTNIIILSIIFILSMAFMYFICNFKIKQYSTTFEEIKTAIANDLELQEEIRGEQGPVGETGATGEQGLTGKTGAAGATGIQGPSGINGVDGEDGATGQTGAQGPAGIAGPQGSAGADGEDGTAGIQGIAGLQGPAGADGEDGATGVISTSTDTSITGILKGTGTKVEAAVADVDYLTPGTVASTYLKLDASNGPITGDLNVQPIVNSETAFTVKDKDGNVVFSVDTVNKRLGIGTDNPSTSFDLLGTARFGGATDYTEFLADGTLKMNGAATVWDDLRVIILTRTSARVSPVFYAGLGGNSEIYSYRFEPNTDNNVYFEVQMPHSWAGTKIYPHVHWTPATTGTGTVRWNLECSWADYSSTYGTSFTYTLDSNIATASQWKHMIADPGTGLTPTTSQDDISTMMICRLYRDGAATEDDYSGYAHLLAFDLHYEINTLGSSEMYTK